MKKICLSVIVILGVLISANMKVNAADNPTINVGIVGEVKAGSTIDIIVDLKNMTSLYAASMDYTYDNTMIEVDKMVVSPNMKNAKVMIAYDDKASNGNKARYGYTNLGEKTGFDGNSHFVTIKAKVLKDGELKITRENLIVKLVKNPTGTSTSEMLTNGNYPTESWEAVQAPTGEITYTSVESKGNSISAERILEITEENKKTLESAGDGTNEGGQKSDLETEAEKVAKAIEEEDKVEKEKETSKEDNNSGIIAIVAIALVGGVTGIVLYRRKNKKVV